MPFGLYQSRACVEWGKLARWALRVPWHTPHTLYAKGPGLLPTGKEIQIGQVFSMKACLREDLQAKRTDTAVLAIKILTHCPSGWRTAAARCPESAHSVSATPVGPPSIQELKCERKSPKAPGACSTQAQGAGTKVRGHALQAYSAFEGRLPG